MSDDAKGWRLEVIVGKNRRVTWVGPIDYDNVRITMADGEMAYLSFADGRLPKGTQFLGAAIVEIAEEHRTLGGDLASRRIFCEAAIRAAWRAGCNPGGGVLTLVVPKNRQIPTCAIGVVLTREQLVELERFWAP